MSEGQGTGVMVSVDRLNITVESMNGEPLDRAYVMAMLPPPESLHGRFVSVHLSDTRAYIEIDPGDGEELERFE